MKLFNNTLSKLVAAAALLVSVSFSSNAALIPADEINGTFTQDILMSINGGNPFVLGSISYGIDFRNNGANEFGDLYTGDAGMSFVGLNIFGGTSFDFGYLELGIDTNDYAAGLTFMAFDALELDFPDEWVYNVIYDNGFGFGDIFASSLIAFGDITLGDVTFVSAPSMLGFMLVLGGLFAARRRLA